MCYQLDRAHFLPAKPFQAVLDPSESIRHHFSTVGLSEGIVSVGTYVPVSPRTYLELSGSKQGGDVLVHLYRELSSVG